MGDSMLETETSSHRSFALVIFFVAGLVLLSLLKNRDVDRYLLLLGQIFIIVRYSRITKCKYTLCDGALLLAIPLGTSMLLTGTLSSWIIYFLLFIVFADGFKDVLFSAVFGLVMAFDIYYTDIFTMLRVFLSIVPALLVYQVLSLLGINKIEVIVLSVVLGAPSIAAYQYVWNFFLVTDNRLPSSYSDDDFRAVVEVMSLSTGVLLGFRALASGVLKSRAAKAVLPSKEAREALEYIMLSLSPLLVLLWTHSLLRHKLGRDPIVWLLEVLLRQNRMALWVSVYWIVAIGITVGLLALKFSRVRGGAEKNSKSVTVVDRKAFHALAVVLFAPPLLFAQFGLLGFVSFALTLALYFFLALEIARCTLYPNSFSMVTAYFNRLSDERDKSMKHGATLSHVYLLLGCALPVWMYAYTQPPTLTPSLLALAPVWGNRLIRLLPHLGWITVGMGDAVAAVVGVCLGCDRCHRWPGSSRTVEGSVAGLLAIFAAGVASLCFIALEGSDNPSGRLGLVLEVGVVGLVALVASLAEAFCPSRLCNDNLLLPVLACAVLLACVSLASPLLPSH